MLRFSSLAHLAVLSMAAVPALVACGSLDADPGSKTPLATVTGQLVNPLSVATGNDVRVAVIWRAEKFGNFAVAVDLPVQPVFPSKFQIQLTDAPPASALYNPFTDNGPSSGGSGGTGPQPGNPGSGGAEPSPGPNPAPDSPPPTGGIGGSDTLETRGGKVAFPADFRAAVGTVVAYEDTNHNGKLDLIDDNAASFVDRIVGANQSLQLIYVQGTLTTALGDDSGHMPTLGYNLFQGGANCATLEPDTKNGADTTPPTPCTPALSAWLPTTALVELELSQEPTLGALMCKNGSGDVASSGTGGGQVHQPNERPATYPAKGTKDLTCSSDGSSYNLGSCTVIDHGPCKGTETTCNYEYWQRPTPIPADWPCSK